LAIVDRGLRGPDLQRHVASVARGINRPVLIVDARTEPFEHAAQRHEDTAVVNDRRNGKIDLRAVDVDGHLRKNGLR
jgi:hypothetical protein